MLYGFIISLLSLIAIWVYSFEMNRREVAAREVVDTPAKQVAVKRRLEEIELADFALDN